MLRKLLRGVVLAAIVGATILVVAFAGKPAKKDYISYWSAGQQLVRHRDPYSRTEVFALEQREGLDTTKPLVMRNPPWSLFLVYPLGFISSRIGLLFWMAVTVGSTAFCLRVFNTPAQERLLGFCFAPVYASLAVGQSSPFLLFGFTSFVMLHRRRPGLAGAALLFMAIKPHLFLVLWPIILLDSIYRRSYRFLAGAATALALASAAATCFDLHIWNHYWNMLKNSGIDGDFIPTPLGALSLFVAPNHRALQFVPCGVAVFWAIHFYWKNRGTWDWSTDSMPLLFVTILVSPYAWMTDEIVLLPAVVLALSTPLRARHTFVLFMVFNTLALAMLMQQVSLPSGAFVWTPIAWFAVYLYGRSGRRTSATEALEPEMAQAA